MRRRLLWLAFAVAALLVASAALAAQRMWIEEPARSTVTKLCLWAWAPAVKGNEEGVATNLTACILEPGSGSTYISVRPLSEIDMQATARIASTVASIYAGKPLQAYDYLVSIRTDVPIVGGPSAGALMSTLFLSLLNGSGIRNTTSMTGMIEPDGTIGPVGGIPAKLIAVAAKGVKVFLVPVGQVIYKDPVTGEVVNLTRLGEKLGVKVVPVGSILQAYEYFTGRRVALPGNLTEQVIELASTPFWRSAAQRLVGELRSLLANTTTLLHYAEGSPGGSAVIAAYERAKGYLRLAEESLRLGYYYTAASEAYAGLIYGTFAYSASKVLEALRVGGFAYAVAVERSIIRNYLSYAHHELLLVNTTVSRIEGNRTCISPEELQVLSAVVRRLAELRAMIGTARSAQSFIKLAVIEGLNLTTAESLPVNLWAASEAYVRAKTLPDWVKQLEYYSTHYEYCTPLTDAWQAVLEYARFARSVAAYAAALGVPPTLGGRPTISTVVEVLSSSRPNPITLAWAAQAVVRKLSHLLTGIHMTFNVTNAIMKYVEGNVAYLAVKLSSRGVTPLLPALYLEYAVTGNHTSVARMFFLESAASYTLLLYMLSSYAPPRTHVAAATFSGKLALPQPLLAVAAAVSLAAALLLLWVVARSGGAG